MDNMTCMEYSDKIVNDMILYLRVNSVMEIYYIDGTSNKTNREKVDDATDLRFYDYKTDSHYTREDVTKIALEEGWKEGWKK